MTSLNVSHFVQNSLKKGDPESNFHETQGCFHIDNKSQEESVTPPHTNTDIGVSEISCDLEKHHLVLYFKSSNNT